MIEVVSKDVLEWARDLAFSEALSELSLKLLSDVRKISPGEVGFDWLMRLAGRSEKRFTAVDDLRTLGCLTGN